MAKLSKYFAPVLPIVRLRLPAKRQHKEKVYTELRHLTCRQLTSRTVANKIALFSNDRAFFVSSISNVWSRVKNY